MSLRPDALTVEGSIIDPNYTRRLDRWRSSASSVGKSLSR